MVVHRISIIDDENVTISICIILGILWIIPIILMTCHVAIRVLPSVVYLRWRDTPGVGFINGSMSPVLNSLIDVRNFWNFWKFGFVLFGFGFCLLWCTVPIIAMMVGVELLLRKVIGCPLSQSGGFYTFPALKFGGHMPSHYYGSFESIHTDVNRFVGADEIERPRTVCGSKITDLAHFSSHGGGGYGGGYVQEVITRLRPLSVKHSMELWWICRGPLRSGYRSRPYSGGVQRILSIYACVFPFNLVLGE